MNTEALKTELARAEDAELQSEEQLRQLLSLIDKVGTPGAQVDATDCGKTVTAALALNDRLRDRVKTLRNAIRADEFPLMRKA
jgi:negative regulator of replication initiation